MDHKDIKYLRSYNSPIKELALPINMWQLFLENRSQLHTHLHTESLIYMYFTVCLLQFKYHFLSFSPMWRQITWLLASETKLA